MLTEFLLPASAERPSGSFPDFITAGSDGNLWFTEAGCGPSCGGNRIGRMTTSGVLTEFALNDADHTGPFGITEGPDGNLWFTEFDPSLVSVSKSVSAGIFKGNRALGLAQWSLMDRRGAEIDDGYRDARWRLGTQDEPHHRQPLGSAGEKNVAV